ncbi:MAG: DUF3800 domain-containing protein [Patescibacteria group bacterium]|jgi:hypothetical protein
MIYAYVDESGNLGRNEGYFIIAMLVSDNPKRLKNIIKSFCARKSIPEVHATDLSFPDKQYLVNKLVKQKDYSISYIIADKMMIENKKLFDNNNLLFNYLFSFLVKDIITSNIGDVVLHLDNRTQKVASVNSLKDYIHIKAFAEWGFDKNLTINYIDSKHSKSVQMADLVANCIHRKYRHGTNDFYSRLNIVKSIKFPSQTFRDRLIF